MDMKRPFSFNNMLANLQESICFFLIKRFFHKIIVVNTDTVNGLINRGFRESRIFKTSNPIHIEYASFLQNYYQKKYDFAFCGRIYEQKGIYDFVDIICDLAKEQPSIKGVMIGTGPEMEKLKKKIKECNAPVEVMGYVNQEQKFKLLSTSRYLLFPSREEGWGIVLAESLSVGTPAIALALPVYAQVFGDNIEIANTIESLRNLAREKITISQTEVYENLQTKNIAFVANFGVHRVAKSEYDFIIK